MNSKTTSTPPKNKSLAKKLMSLLPILVLLELVGASIFLIYVYQLQKEAYEFYDRTSESEFNLNISITNDQKAAAIEWEKLKPQNTVTGLDDLKTLPIDFITKVIPTKQKEQYLLLSNVDIDEPDNTLAAIYLYDINENKIIDTIIKVPFADFSPGELLYRDNSYQYMTKEEKQAEIKKYDLSVVNHIKWGCPHPSCFGNGVEDMVLSEDGKTGYAVSLERGALSIIDIENKKITATVKLSEFPKRVAISQNKIYVADLSTSTLFVLDRHSLFLQKTLSWDVGFEMRYSTSRMSALIVSEDENDVYFVTKYGLYLANLADNTFSQSEMEIMAFNVHDVGRNRDGQLWVLTRDFIYYPETKDTIRFDCQYDSVYHEVDALYGRSLRLLELDDGTMMPVQLNKYDYQTEKFEGYSAQTGQLIRSWPFSNDLLDVMSIGDQQYFFVRGFYHNYLVNLNESLLLTDDDRKNSSLGRYSCLFGEIRTSKYYY